MNNSILTSVKKLMGIEEDYEVFDMDLIIHINTVFSILTQLGVGPETGFSIVDKKSMWTDFVIDLSLMEMVRTYMFMKVRLMFDPPTSGSAMEALNKVIDELEWRLRVQAEVSPPPNDGGNN